MKIASVRANGRRRAFEVIAAKRTYLFPYALSVPRPSGKDPVKEVFPDLELGKEAFTYVLASGNEGTVHLDSVREVNEEPKYLADLLLYKLSIEADRQMKNSGRTARDIAEELGTSPAQLYRLIDPTNYTKSFRQLATLLNILGCTVEFNVTEKHGARKKTAHRINESVSVGS